MLINKSRVKSDDEVLLYMTFPLHILITNNSGFMHES